MSLPVQQNPDDKEWLYYRAVCESYITIRAEMLDGFEELRNYFAKRLVNSVQIRHWWRCNGRASPGHAGEDGLLS